MLDRHLVKRLRELAKQRASARMMACEIAERSGHPSIEECPILLLEHYTWKSFFLSLRRVRDIEACDWRGGHLSDEEIDALLLPEIARTSHLWENDPDPD
jgi:hypothetical protein